MDYWNITNPIQLHIVYGCFCTITELCRRIKIVWCAKQKKKKKVLSSSLQKTFANSALSGCS